ncbi:MAG: hypothetical protein K2N71_05450 [Oscillospiraceae bacterium]|nr:hypothetical protein [Oscillospiraceae bacterium]
MNITSMNAVDLYKTLADPTRVKTEFATPEDTANETKKFDRFESSGVDSIESLMGLNSPTSFMYLKSGLGMSDNEIAEHVGGIGKRLDEAYASGKFTKEEYDELNASLNDYAVKLANKSKRMEASWSLTRNLSPLEFSMKTQKAESMNAKDYLADRKAEIDAYIKQNPVDMEFIFKMINAVRRGTGKLIG